MKPEDTGEPESIPELPATEQAELNSSQLDDLFRDLSACTEVKHITIKSAEVDANADVIENPDLVHARWLMDQASTRAVQVRYAYEGSLWVDTLTKRDGSFHLIRIQHAN